MDICKDSEGRAIICGRCRHADIKKGFCRVTAKYIHANSLACKCRFFRERKEQKGVENGGQDVR